MMKAWQLPTRCPVLTFNWIKLSPAVVLRYLLIWILFKILPDNFDHCLMRYNTIVKNITIYEHWNNVWPILSLCFCADGMVLYIIDQTPRRVKQVIFFPRAIWNRKLLWNCAWKSWCSTTYNFINFIANVKSVKRHVLSNRIVVRY